MPRASRAKAKSSPSGQSWSVKHVLAWLKKNSSTTFRDGLARYGLPTTHAYGVPMNAVQKLAKEIGRNHSLVDPLWDTAVYEARLLVAFIGEPEKLTLTQMERWCREFDNWAVVDTLCFKLFDQTPLGWKKVPQWVKREDEFQKRAGFVMIACLAAHDKHASNEQFLETLPFIEREATDVRNFVKKGVSWALRMVGRRNEALNAASIALSERLIASGDVTARWVGKTALKELTSAAVKKKIAAK